MRTAPRSRPPPARGAPHEGSSGAIAMPGVPGSGSASRDKGSRATRRTKFKQTTNPQPCEKSVSPRARSCAEPWGDPAAEPPPHPAERPTCPARPRTGLALQLAVIGLLAGREVLLHQEGARHLGAPEPPPPRGRGAAAPADKCAGPGARRGAGAGPPPGAAANGPGGTGRARAGVSPAAGGRAEPSRAGPCCSARPVLDGERTADAAASAAPDFSPECFPGQCPRGSSRCSGAGRNPGVTHSPCPAQAERPWGWRKALCLAGDPRTPCCLSFPTAGDCGTGWDKPRQAPAMPCWDIALR